MLFLSELVLKELPMVQAFALLGIYFFNAIIALFLGTTSFYRDVERKTVYFILAKPVSRAQFLIGKFLGLCAVIFLTSLLLAVAYLAVVALAGGGFDALGLLAVLMQWLEMALLSPLPFSFPPSRARSFRSSIRQPFSSLATSCRRSWMMPAR